MGSAPGLMIMLTLPQKHVAEGAACADILAVLRDSSSAVQVRATADAKSMHRSGAHRTSHRMYQFVPQW